MGVIATDDRPAIGAGGFQRGEMIFRIDFETILPRRDVARGMKRQGMHHARIGHAFDQPATFRRIGRARLVSIRACKARGKVNFIFRPLALTCPTR